MSAWFYRAVYRFGFTPWERLAELPAARQLHALLDREELGRQPPLGPALDLGCGTGGWSVELARRGWQVTGIDLFPRAVAAARERARAAGVAVRFVQGDVAVLRDTDVGTGFRLVLDCGTVHGLAADKRAAVGQSVTALTVPGSALLMYAYAPGRRGPLPQGMSRADIEAAWAGWRVTDEIPFDPAGLPESSRAWDPRWYRLERG